MSVDTNLIIIGAGPGGYETAIAAAKKGISTVLVESAHVGGTCLNEGCIPTKCFCHNAEVYDLVRQSSTYGITSSEIQFQLDFVVQRKDEVVSQLRTGIHSLLRSPFIKLVEGHAEMVGSHEVRVGDTVYTAPYIIIATGSEAKLLPVPGADGEGVVTARELLDLRTLPKHLCIIGGGVIGLEFASVFSSFGSEITVVEFAKEVIPAFDRDIAKRLRMALKHRGITFHLSSAVTGIVPSDEGYEVLFESAGKSGKVQTDLVLMAVGRGARVESLGLEAAGIQYDRRGIVVDEHLQTNVEGVFAIGDVNGICPLAHAATAQGKYVLEYITGGTEFPNLKLVPAAIFTVPEVASVGLTEEQAKVQNIPYTTQKSFYRASGKALAMGCPDGLVKVMIDDSHTIIGAHILGAHASDLIHEIALAMHAGLKISQLSTLIHAHPSLSEMVHETVS